MFVFFRGRESFPADAFEVAGEQRAADWRIPIAPQGGGFVRNVPIVMLRACDDDEIADKYVAAMFNVEGGEAFSGSTRFYYPGFHCGKRWNGWAMPLFERSVLMLWLKECGWTASYDESADVFTLVYEGDEDTRMECHPHDIVVNGRTFHVYDAGDGVCWDVSDGNVSDGDGKDD